MEKFKEYIAGKADIESLPIVELTEMMALYPWFSTGRIVMAARTGKIDPLLSLHLINRPAPAIFLQKFSADEFARRSEAEIINSFLEQGERKITPQGQDTGNAEDMSKSEVALEGEVLTENLAQIYHDQHLYDKAKEVYAKLSLIYPEKSAYFAELIREIDNEEKSN